MGAVYQSTLGLQHLRNSWCTSRSPSALSTQYDPSFVCQCRYSPQCRSHSIGGEMSGIHYHSEIGQKLWVSWHNTVVLVKYLCIENWAVLIKMIKSLQKKKITTLMFIYIFKKKSLAQKRTLFMSKNWVGKYLPADKRRKEIVEIDIQWQDYWSRDSWDPDHSGIKTY